MRNLACLILIVSLLASCSSSPEPAESKAGGFLGPVREGGTALDGALRIENLEFDGRAGGWFLDVRNVSSAAVRCWVHPRVYEDDTLALEYRAECFGWVELRLGPDEVAAVGVAAPYPFAPTLGLSFAAGARPEPGGEGKPLPGRLTVTEEQYRKLDLIGYGDLELKRYESRTRPTAPKLAVWRAKNGRVVAAVEIYVRNGAPATKADARFVHTNVKPEIGASLMYVQGGSAAGGGDAGRREFVKFRQSEGRWVAAPWKPLIRNASYLGSVEPGGLGLDVREFGSECSMLSVDSKGAKTEARQTLAPPDWSVAHPTAGSLKTGAPVEASYGGESRKAWTVETDADLRFEAESGAGTTGTFPAGSGTEKIGKLYASSPGNHRFVYGSEPLYADPGSADRMLQGDGPKCLSGSETDTANVWTSRKDRDFVGIPGLTKREAGKYAIAAVAVTAAAGTAIYAITQKDSDPGFTAVATDGDRTDADLAFTAEPADPADRNTVFCSDKDGVVCDNGGDRKKAKDAVGGRKGRGADVTLGPGPIGDPPTTGGGTTIQPGTCKYELKESPGEFKSILYDFYLADGGAYYAIKHGKPKDERGILAGWMRVRKYKNGSVQVNLRIFGALNGAEIVTFDAGSGAADWGEFNTRSITIVHDREKCDSGHDPNCVVRVQADGAIKSTIDLQNWPGWSNAHVTSRVMGSLWTIGLAPETNDTKRLDGEIQNDEQPKFSVEIEVGHGKEGPSGSLRGTAEWQPGPPQAGKAGAESVSIQKDLKCGRSGILKWKGIVSIHGYLDDYLLTAEIFARPTEFTAEIVEQCKHP